jgi:aspartate racemase
MHGVATAINKSRIGWPGSPRGAESAALDIDRAATSPTLVSFGSIDVKTIGIVGGVAWPSSVVYYRVINELIGRRLGDGGLHSANLVLAQTDFEEIEHNQRLGRWDLVGELIAAQGNKLKAAGADFFLIACNTVHAAAEYVESAVDLPFIHIVDPTARLVLERGFRTVGLLGSRYTMTGSYFADRLRQHHGLNVLVAEGEHQDNVHNALYEELAKGIFRPSTHDKFNAAMGDLADRGAEVIILGCTEFGMLVEPEDSTVPIIDTTLTHAEAAVDMALADSARSGEG